MEGRSFCFYLLVGAAKLFNYCPEMLSVILSFLLLLLISVASPQQPNDARWLSRESSSHRGPAGGDGWSRRGPRVHGSSSPQHFCPANDWREGEWEEGRKETQWFTFWIKKQQLLLWLSLFSRWGLLSQRPVTSCQRDTETEDQLLGRLAWIFFSSPFLCGMTGVPKWNIN